MNKRKNTAAKISKKTIKSRLLLNFFFLVFLPSVFAFGAILNIYTTHASKTSISATQGMITEINNTIDANLQKYNNLTMQIYYNQEIINALSSKMSTPYEQVLVEEFVNSIANTDRFIASAYLTTAGKTISKGTQYRNVEQYFADNRQAVLQNGGRLTWLPTKMQVNDFGVETDVFVAARAIREDNQNIGILWLFLKEKFFEEAYSKSFFSPDSVNVILTEQKDVIACTESVDARAYLSDSVLDQAIGMKRGSFESKVNGETSIVVFSPSSVSDWIFLNVTAKAVILSEVSKLQKMMIAIFTLYIFFISSILFVLSKYVFKPLRKLAGGMNEIATGNLEVAIEFPCEDEIGVLSTNFNHMVQQIKQLIVQLKKEETEKNNAKIQALAMQISPHFIYNTLNSVRWMAVMNKQKNIELMTKSLITLMSNVMKSGNELCTIEQEIELLEHYIYIQKLRYMNFDVNVTIPEEIRQCKINKFLLQPIVENAIIHGLSGSDKVGVITISAQIDGDISIFIEDNGKGFDTEKLENGAGNIGIQNVHDRLLLEYGSPYGLHIESELGIGTRVTIKIPGMR